MREKGLKKTTKKQRVGEEEEGEGTEMVLEGKFNKRVEQSECIPKGWWRKVAQERVKGGKRGRGMEDIKEKNYFRASQTQREQSRIN